MALEPETAINDLEIACLVRIFGLLPPRDCGRAAAVHSLWDSVLADDAIWRRHLAADFAAGAPINPDESPARSYRAAYTAWQAAYADVAGPLFARALACWACIKRHLSAHSPQILATLRPGATREQVAAAEQQLGHPLPPALRCIYRVHDGQDLQLQQASCEDGPPRGIMLGLFGCLVFYEHITSNALQPLANVVKYTSLLRAVRPLGARTPRLPARHAVFACGFRVTDKLCVVDCDSGEGYMKLHQQDWPLAPSGCGAGDGVLRWMEEYARRLAAGWYGGCTADASLAGSGISTDGAISLYPRAFPAAATAITRGVQVSWSSVLVPQESHGNRLLFAYSVRFALLTPQQEAQALRRLAGEQAAWQQHVQQQLQSQAGSSVASSSRSSSSGAAGRQAVVVGPCDAAAGAACVPDALRLPAPAWAAAAAAAAGDGAAPAAASPAGSADAAAAAAAGGAGSGSGSSGAGSSSSSSSSEALSSCQLESRNWAILGPSSAVTDRVSGEGVVGLYPLLVPGGEEFAYASCTPCSLEPRGARRAGGHDDEAAGGEAPEGRGAGEGGQARPGAVLGAMEGSFAFVPGSLMQRRGPGFSVHCPRLAFAVPEFLY